MLWVLTAFTRGRKAKLAISWTFISVGGILGNLAGLLPTIKDRQGLSNSTLGLTLMAAIFGAICSLPFVTHVVNRFGSAVGLLTGCLLVPALFPLISISHNLPVFVVGIFSLGFVLGWCDVCMNNQAVICEKMTRTPTLGLFHAMYAIGGLGGALLAGALIEEGVSVLNEIICFCVLTVVPEILLSCWLFAAQEEKLINQTALLSGHDHSDQKVIEPELAAILESSDSQTDWQDFSEDDTDLLGSSVDRSTLICLCSLCFLAYLGEGSVGDWSTIYLDEVLGTSPFTSTLGYVGFELAVAVARVSSDYLVIHVGRRRLLQIAGLVTAGGLAIVGSAAWVNTAWGRDYALAASIVGFSCTGAGIGVVAPSVISLAGDIHGMNPADAIGLVSSVGYLGVMVGPPLLGGLSALCHGLEYSFFVDAVFMLGITGLALFVKRPTESSCRDNSSREYRPVHYEGVIQ